MSKVTPLWPLVSENDDGIRPAGAPDECFYCKQKVGSQHGRDCVVVEKRIRIRVSFEYDVSVPHCWDGSTIDWHYNDSSYCKSNILDDLTRVDEKHQCLCRVPDLEVSVVYMETVDDTPKQKDKGVEMDHSASFHDDLSE